jgi:hypothetical protein
MKKITHSWLQKNRDFHDRYGMKPVISRAPWYWRLWFAVTNPITYVLFGFKRL